MSSKKEPVTFTGNITCTMIGKGITGVIDNPFLKNIYLVESLEYNLISINQLCDKGCSVNFKKYECTITQHFTSCR